MRGAVQSSSSVSKFSCRSSVSSSASSGLPPISLLFPRFMMPLGAILSIYFLHTLHN